MSMRMRYNGRMNGYWHQITAIGREIPIEQLRRFSQRRDWRGWLDVSFDWIVITASFALVAWEPTVFTIVIALIVLGGRQLGLAVLMHEAAHGTLFRTRFLNDFV